jgi:hypothetical protein
MIAKKTSKNQLTLPKKVVEQFPDVEYFDLSVDETKDLAGAGPAGPVARSAVPDGPAGDLRAYIREAVASARKGQGHPRR